MLYSRPDDGLRCGQGQGLGNDFFLGGGGKNVDMPTLLKISSVFAVTQHIAVFSQLMFIYCYCL